MRNNQPNFRNIVFLVLSIALFMGCRKNTMDDSELPPKLAMEILKVSDYIDIRLSSTIDTKNKIERKVEYIDKATNAVIDEYIIELATTNANNSVWNDLKNQTLTGSLQIKHAGQTVAEWMVVNGKSKRSNKADFNDNNGMKLLMHPVAGALIKMVHNCVASKIDDMNIIEYGLCLFSAPGCYGGLWAICAYDVSALGKRYPAK